MPPRFPYPWVITCGVLLLPVFAWNAALAKHLPAPISDPVVWGAIPPSLALIENVLRILVFVIPFFLTLRVSSTRQRAALAVFVIGTLVYFASWLPLIAAPQSSWSTSPAGFLAPAFTPALWLLGLALLGQRFSWGAACRPWVYGTLSSLFLAVHIAHGAIVYVHNY